MKTRQTFDDISLSLVRSERAQILYKASDQLVFATSK